jgi:photosystem II stability/assembly factor-like uncharacterized protein
VNSRDLRKSLERLPVPPEGRERAVDAARSEVGRPAQSRRGSRRYALALALVVLAALIGVSFTPPGEAATGWVGRLVGVDSNTSSSPRTSLKGMVPLSVTFVSDQEGWMLGGLGCDGRACHQAVLETNDYGHDWRPISRLATGAEGAWAGAPAVEGLGSPRTVNEIRFADGDDGWAFGSGLYATHDSGHTWQPIHLPGFVTDVEASNGRAYALVADCHTGSGWCSSGQLYEATTGSDQFRPVPGLPRFTDPKGRSFSARIVLHGSAAYVVARTEFKASLAASPDGRSWQMRQLPCGSWFGDNSGASQLGAWSETGLVLFCGFGPGAGNQLKSVYESGDAGRTWRRVEDPPSTGYAASIAAASADDWYIANQRGPIEMTSDGGQTWQRGPHGPAWEGFGWIGFTDDTHGVALPALDRVGAAWFTESGPDGWYQASW